ncbi:MAG: prolyl oligopeptidase family serine peptidase [Saprospiraceae bacterium]|nr:prolyl oligopeptidase family serine peptidase [Saprospiraceae bacterium]
MQGPDFIGNLPQRPVWSPNNETIYFFWDRDTLPDAEMYQFALGTDTPKRLSLAERKMVTTAQGIYSDDYTYRLYQQHGDLFLATGEDVLQVTNTIQRESPLGFSLDNEWILFESADNIFRWSMKNGTTEQLTDFRKGSAREEAKKSEQEDWLERDQLEYFKILRERERAQEFREDLREKLAPSRPKEIYLGKKKLDEVVCSPDMNYIIYRLEERMEPEGTIVPDYVTQSGFTKDLSARSKVGGKQPAYFSFIYDRLRDTIIEIGTNSIPGILEKPAFYRDYHAGPEAYVDTFETPRAVAILGPVFNSDGSHAVVIIRSEDHKDRWIMELDLDQASLSLIDRQHDDAWIGGPGVGGWGFSRGNIGFISNQKLWFQSEETGYSHLYTYDFETKQKVGLTEGEFEILDANLSRDRSTFFIYSNRENPYENHFYHFSIKDRQWLKITDEPGDYAVEISPDEKRLAVLYSYSNQPTELFWMSNEPGARMHQITSSTSEAFKSYPWRDPSIIEFKARDGVMVPARIYEPAPSRKNGAAVIFVHGAGYLHNVHKYWSSYYREYMFHNYLADQGYTVLDIDYRGSAGYGRDWRTAIYRFMGGKDLDDQVDGAKFLIEQKKIDPDRLGIYGGSYGGFITLMALCTAPGTFKCGAALRSVTDWAHYNHGYTSNILNTPVEDSIAFYRSSPIYHAKGLQGNLLMLHGMVDRNVHFQDVVRMSQRFIELGKENWELAVFPMEDHGFIEPSSWANEYRRIFQLFEKHLRSDK